MLKQLVACAPLLFLPYCLSINLFIVVLNLKLSVVKPTSWKPHTEKQNNKKLNIYRYN